MPPPPKPPVICYDLHTDANARRTPCARYRVSAIGVSSSKSKVTLIPTKHSELERTDTCWHHSYEHEADDEYEISRRIPVRHRVPQRKLHENNKDHLLKTQHSNQQMMNSESYHKHRTTSFGSSLNRQSSSVAPPVRCQQQQQVRYEYDQKLKERLKHRERLEEGKKQKAAVIAQLDTTIHELEPVKRVLANLTHTYGMSHQAAKYFQKKDEDYANLKRKVDQSARMRSRDAERQLQQKKQLYKFQQQEDREVELRRLRDIPRLANNKHKLTSTLNRSLSSSSSGISTRNSPSSTISISTCSSPMSSTEERPQHRNLSHHNSHLVDRASPSNKSPASSFAPSSTSKTHNRYHSSILKTQPKRPPIDFSFYKGPPHNCRETLEVTDINFLEKVEDKTMLEVNELLKEVQSVLGDSYDEQCIYNETGDISQLRSQVDNLEIQTPDYCNQSYHIDY